ncbi:MAG: sigma-70 family RNA polymerase sigma factor [Rhizobiaceae bacterium]
MNADELASLLPRIALKDRAAFDRLYALVAPKLFGVLLRILVQRSEAEDALQEVFVKIWSRADRYAQSDASALGWLCTIARNHAIDKIRARQRPAQPIDEAFDIADESPDPERMAVNASEGRRIDSCMEQLGADRADAVRLAYIEGRSYEELAVRFSVPLNTMRTWLRRSLMKLKECLEQ